MAYAWFVCPYKVTVNPKNGLHNQRYCAMDDFTAQILADGGRWTESEILGNVAVVKVRANAATLTAIAGTTGFVRVTNHWLLADTLSDLTTAQRTAIQNKLLAMGYTQTEINTTMGNTLALWRQKNLRTLLRFAATRRRKPRYDPGTDTIILDGEVVTPRAIEHVDGEIT